MFIPIFLPVTGLAFMRYIFIGEALLLLAILAIVAMGKKTWSCDRCREDSKG